MGNDVTLVKGVWAAGQSSATALKYNAGGGKPLTEDESKYNDSMRWIFGDQDPSNQFGNGSIDETTDYYSQEIFTLQKSLVDEAAHFGPEITIAQARQYFQDAQQYAIKADSDYQGISISLEQYKTQYKWMKAYAGKDKVRLEGVKRMEAVIKAAEKALKEAETRRDTIKEAIAVGEQIVNAAEAAQKAQKAREQADQDLAKADAAVQEAGQAVGSQDAARKRDDIVNKAEIDAEQQVSDAEDAVQAAEDAVASLPTDASADIKAKVRRLLESARENLRRAQEDLAKIKKDHEKSQAAIKAAADAEAAKNQQEIDAFKNKITALIEQIKKTTTQASLQNVRDMLSASQYAAQQMAITGQATITQAQISLASEKMTVQQQLSELAMRAGATGYSNLLAQMAYVEAIREKAFNLEADIEKNRVDNAFTRAKAAAQLSKY